MGVPGSANPLLLVQQGSTQYTVARSVRLNAADSAFFSRTPSSAGNRKTWTFSCWVKRSAIGTDSWILNCGNTGSDTDLINFGFFPDALAFGTGTRTVLATTSVYRDTSAWYHIVLSVDTTNATADNRQRLYVNGVEVTAFSTRSNFTLNQDTGINQAFVHYIGRREAAVYFSGYLANVEFVDGQQLTPSSFTEVSATTGQLVPKQYSGSYGTNGFKLDFADNSAATAAALGKDTSGNGNNWTPNNLSVTAGAGNDSLVDTPTSYGTDTGAGGEVRGNYATWNPLYNIISQVVTFSDGNLKANRILSNSYWVTGTLVVPTGKWYYEVTMDQAANSFSTTYYPMLGANFNDGVINYDINGLPGFAGGASSFSWMPDGTVNTNIGTKQANASSYTANDVLGVAVDMDAGTIRLYKNGVAQNSGNAVITGISATQMTVSAGLRGGSMTLNTGQRSFTAGPGTNGAAPSGFKALCDTNLPTPVVAKPNTVFDTVLWTGNGSSKTISGLAFSPDLVWAKVRSTNYNHTLFDAVRGATQTLSSSMTVPEYTEPTGPTAFTSDGWSMSGDVTYVGSVNANNQTYVGWVWDAGSSNATNTQGSITSTVRANASAGFSIVTYTGGAANSTVGHGLGAAPHLIIAKSRYSPSYTTSSWDVYHRSLGKDKYLYLEKTDAAATYSNYWGSVEPTSTVFGVSLVDFFNNRGNMVAYCFAPVSGYSSFGLYDAGTDPFVYLGFRPAMIIFKRSNGAENWNIVDNRRNAVGDANVVTYSLQPNSSGAEYQSEPGIDLLSNGFKLRGSFNSAGGQYIYAAWAASPFQYARAR